ncbi:fumarylacetoacetate hydrolase family protein [Solimicrobium silvestre]|uniref:2-keto-4-pentenoate hydratase/2-oxohepta-3-ene-17-dioic acid hydratase (Catechol pathway) n=1 Tax=Solimicrobium silvestre TaxID=2099400 RepID=A0A2S9H3H3_9BURK|nr:fumarylacetoacetate hydrolase family protein [Solimicrobium silvestre]PRC94528.1 2-keto-4-pentenoate hydratase/2-oxohepta-3-ene-17-dioic acid hydratase (catechol pathway) [Solimicrobium silvestre]
MSYIFPPEAVTALKVAASSDLFAVRRVYCVGRNYAAHAREMGSDPTREAPFFFCKPANAVTPITDGQTLELAYPGVTTNFHHEIELVVAIGKAGRDIPVAQANAHVWGYAVGLDMTRRDLQGQMKDKGKPWEIGKAFDHSAPIGNLYPVDQVGLLNINKAAIYLKVNGSDKQRSNIDQMTWSVPEIISHLSSYFELKPGDLIMTGTPEGVGAVLVGDVLEGGIAGLGGIRVRVV